MKHFYGHQGLINADEIIEDYYKCPFCLEIKSAPEFKLHN